MTPKGVALLLNGLPSLRHVIYDVMSDVLTYVDFNTSEAVLPQFGLKTMLFHSMELLSSNHLELVTKLCLRVEWLSLDSALFYNLEGLGHLPRLRLLRLNYKSRPIDQTVVDFFCNNGRNLATLHMVEVKDLHVSDLYYTVGQCLALEHLVLNDCSFRADVDHFSVASGGSGGGNLKGKPLSQTAVHVQLLSVQILPGQLVDFLHLFPDLQILEMDRCDLDLNQVKRVLLNHPELHTLRCLHWTHTSAKNLSDLQLDFRNRKLQMNRKDFNFDSDPSAQTMAATLLADYAGISPLLNFDTLTV